MKLSKPAAKTHAVYRIPAYENTRKLMIWEVMTAQSINVLAQGSFLAGFLKFLGINSTVSAVLMQLPLLACSIEIFSPGFFEKRSERLKFVWIFSTIYRSLLFVAGFAVVFLPTLQLKAIFFAVMILLSYAFCYIGECGWVEFMSNVVPFQLRGRYLSKRDAFMTFASTAISLLAGAMLDFFRGNRQEGIGFRFVFIAIAVFMVINSICLSKMKQPPVHICKDRISPLDVLKIPLRNKRYRKYIIFNLAYSFGMFIASSYFAIYLVTNLNLPYTYIALMTIVSTVSRIASAKLWSWLPTRFSWPTVLAVSMLVISACHALYGITTVQNVYVILPLANIAAGVGWGGNNVSMLSNNMLFAPQMRRTVYFSFNAVAGNAVGFLAAIFGAWLCQALTPVKLDLFLFTVSNVQIMFFISSAMLAAVAVYSLTVLKKEAAGAV